MVSAFLILIGLTLIYALMTNKTSDLLAALLTGTAPGGAGSAQSPNTPVHVPGQPSPGI